MLSRQMESSSSREAQERDRDHDEEIRDIYALTPSVPPLPPSPGTSGGGGRRRETWETSSHRSSSLSVGSEGASSENFTSMSREFNALVLAGSSMENNRNEHENNGVNNLERIGEEAETFEETNPLAIVPDNNPLPSPGGGGSGSGSGGGAGAEVTSGNHREVTVHRVKREEVETKISAWQTAKIAKINNRFKREDAVISGWESEQVQKASTRMKKVERKLEEKRAKALEKMQNSVARAKRESEERRASAEAKRATKVARVLEIANLMKAVGRPPAKRSFF